MTVQCLFSSCVLYTITIPILPAKIEHPSFGRLPPFPGAFASTWHQIQLWFFGFEFSVLLFWKTIVGEGVGIITYFWYRACFQHIPFCTTSIARCVLFWRFSDPWSSRLQVTSHLLMCLSTASMVSRRHEWQKPKAPKVEIQHIQQCLKAFEHELTMSIAADHHLHYSGHNAAR